VWLVLDPLGGQLVDRLLDGLRGVRLAAVVGGRAVVEEFDLLKVVTSMKTAPRSSPSRPRRRGIATRRSQI
jgi:hypothetical protein